MEKLGFDLQVEESRELISLSERFDAPALYFGWWKSAPEGALATHIHSLSAKTVRSRTQAWIGPLIARGVAATLGNVYEPYLHLSNHPHLFLEALAASKMLGDAAYYSLPALSWQAVLIGAPLYRTFAVLLAQQLEAAARRTDRLDAYAVLRRMRLLQAEGRDKEALEAGLREFIQKPWPRVGLCLGAGLSRGRAA